MFASIEYLAQVTHLNRKTVIDAIARLRELGVLQDTGRRAGDNRSSIIYRLCPNAVPLIDFKRAPGITARSVQQAPHTDLDVDQPSTYPDPSQEDANAWVLEPHPVALFEEGAYASPPGPQVGLPTSSTYSAHTEDEITSHCAVGDGLLSPRQ